MKKTILSLGTSLNKKQQLQINGGNFRCVDSNKACRGNHECPKFQGCFLELSGDAFCKCL